MVEEIVKENNANYNIVVFWQRFSQGFCACRKVHENMQIQPSVFATEKIEKSRRKEMINFEEELKKFQPSLEVEEAEDAIYDRDLTDMTDILLEMMKERSN